VDGTAGNALLHFVGKICERVLLGKVAYFAHIWSHEAAVLLKALEIADTLHTAVVFSYGLVILNADPKAQWKLQKLCYVSVASRKISKKRKHNAQG
jgi:hypothetical protein